MPVMTGKGRLRRLSRLLKAHHAKGLHFDMGMWTYCAMGIAGADPVFQRQGFSCDWLGPRYAGWRGDSYLSVQKFFKISSERSMKLFGSLGPNMDADALQVAESIDSYLAGQA